MSSLQNRTSATGQARGFTQTDLMAALAALAVIAGLVLPALAASNSGNSRTVCFNNMRQMGLAMRMYAGDYQDYLAFCNWDGDQAPVQGYLYGPGPAPLPPVSPASPYYAFAWKTGLWFKYINDPNAYLCPLDVQQTNYTQRNNKLCSYVMNGAACGFEAGGGTCKIAQIWSPNCYLMWEPDSTTSSSAGANEYNDGANYPTAPPAGNEGVGLLHTTTGGNLLRCDGGIAFITATNFAKDSNTPVGEGPGPGGRTLLWWSTLSSNGH